MKKSISLFAIALTTTFLAHAAVNQEEAARLGKDLTPWGAEKAGNKEGTIPAYTGGLSPKLMGAGYDSNKNLVKGNTVVPDPFKDDAVLYSITSKNMDQYADKLSEATKVMLKTYPTTYRLDVYPTRRVVNYPQSFLDASIKNATRCKTEKGGMTMKGCHGGYPFPIPKDGYEMMWNLQVAAYKGPGVDSNTTQWYVDSSGSRVLTSEESSFMDFPYQNPNYSLEEFENPSKPYSGINYRYNMIRHAPARVAGEATILKSFAKDSDQGSWSYQPGNRRVRALPNASYDFPISSAGGAAFYDELFVFSGRMDKFDFKLVGKKEMLIPYNTYKMAWADPATAMPGKGHLNPDLTRWELHRVWVVDATLKPGARHVYSKRRFYVDEDTAVGGMADSWDQAGKLYRGTFSSPNWIWDYQVSATTFFNYDANTGVLYVGQHMGGVTQGGMRFRKASGIGGFDNGPLHPDSDFTPEALARRSSR
jgi:hypothetical protein